MDDSQLAATKDITSFLRARLGEEHEPEPWRKDIAATHELAVDVVFDTTGEIIAEPLVIARRAEIQVAVYATDANPPVLSDSGSKTPASSSGSWANRLDTPTRHDGHHPSPGFYLTPPRAIAAEPLGTSRSLGCFV